MQNQVNAAIVVLAFKRSDTLARVLQSIKEAQTREYVEIVFVQQGNSPEIFSLISEFNSIPSKYLKFHREDANSSEHAINLNMYAGISEAFQNQEIDFVTILEDDILVARDFLKFNIEMFKRHRLDSDFRGVNGFSGIPRNSLNQFTYSKQRFGLGWGWSITRQTWMELKKFWIGVENFHWDGLVESFCKSGYVIMPSQSRVFNLGFDKDATHTGNSEEVRQIEAKLNESFTQNHSTNDSYVEVQEKQNWRSDCLPYLGRETLKGKSVQMIYNLQEFVRIKPNDSKFSVKTKGKILGILQRILSGIVKPFPS